MGNKNVGIHSNSAPSSAYCDDNTTCYGGNRIIAIID